MDPPSAFHASPSVYYSIWVVCLRAGVSVRVLMFEFVCTAPERAYQSSLHVDVLPLEAIVCASDGAALVSHMRALAPTVLAAPRSPPGQERVGYTRTLCLSLVGCVSRCGDESDASA